jgi:hypothetical protein
MSTVRVAPVTNPVKSYECEKDREVVPTSDTYSWTFETHIFSIGQPDHGGDVNIFAV